MRQAGPHRTHSSDFILWTWTLPIDASRIFLWGGQKGSVKMLGWHSHNTHCMPKSGACRIFSEGMHGLKVFFSP